MFQHKFHLKTKNANIREEIQLLINTNYIDNTQNFECYQQTQKRLLLGSELKSNVFQSAI